MRALAFSDVHLDHVTEGLPRFNDIEKALMGVCKHAIRDKVDRVFFLGDLCDPDKNLSVVRCIRVIQTMALVLSQHGIKSHWLAGNHDVIEDGSGATTLTPLEALVPGNDCIRVHERPNFGCYAGLDIIVLPFTPLSHTYDPEEVIRDAHRQRIDSSDLPLVILSHLVVEGIQPGEETTEMPRGRDIVLPHKLIKELLPNALILQGHYHRRQKYENVNVVGSLVNLTFGEELHHPGYVEVDI
jgi:DNA repair exonuclease SbcCD nuclease subunit